MHGKLSEIFAGRLIPKDKRVYRPLITIQNKVLDETAAKDYECLKSNVTLVPVAITGLQVWVYLQGPWRLLHETHFPGQL